MIDLKKFKLRKFDDKQIGRQNINFQFRHLITIYIIFLFSHLINVSSSEEKKIQNNLALEFECFPIYI